MNDMTRKSIADYALNQRAWASTGTTFNLRVRAAINLVLMDIVRRAPSAIASRTFHTFLYPQLKSTDDDVNAVLNATDDEMVLKFTTRAGADLSSWVPRVNGSWDHVMYLEITRPDGVVERRRSREWALLANAGQGWTGYHVSLDRAWRNTTDEDMEFRIYQPYIWLPSGAQGIINPVNVWSSDRIRPLMISTGEFDRNYFRDFQGENEGPPEHIYPGRELFTLISPQTAPTVTAGSSNTWGTTEWQEGKFRFYQTFVVGRTDPRWQESPGEVAQDPIYESTASPPSEWFDHASNAGKSAIINLRSPDQMLNFALTAQRRYGLTGYRSRVYVEQQNVRVAGRGAFNNVDADSRPLLIGEVEGYETSLTWTGSVVPDKLRPLRASTGYRPWAIHPNADQEYELDIDCHMRPDEVVNDYDTIPIDPIHFKGFVAGVLAELAGMDGVDMAGKRQYDLEYTAWLKPFIAAQANPTGRVSQPFFGIRRRERRPFTGFDYNP